MMGRCCVGGTWNVELLFSQLLSLDYLGTHVTYDSDESLKRSNTYIIGTQRSVVCHLYCQEDMKFGLC